ncbi:hypothetical protein VNI00_017885 [Paramarasmius palmivorus]|uniref:Mid2 domain-containing protein n=1 Tax=Paramarasmius palmivorus TaxID=297713 RepID=A0AAW0B5G2_9AGAR
MEYKLWMCSIVALASAVKGFKFTDVDPKSPTLQPGGKVDLSITWERESDDEKKDQITFLLHLDSEGNPMAGNIFGSPLLAPTSQSPSQVTFNNVAAGPIGRSQDTIEVEGPDNATPPASTSSPPATNPGNNDPRQTSTNGTPPTIVTSVTMQTTSSATAKAVDSEQINTGTSTINLSGTLTPGNNSLNDSATSSLSDSFQGSTSSSATSSLSDSFRGSTSGIAPNGSSSNISDQPHGRMVGFIAGPIAGVVVLITIVSCVITLRRRARRKKLRSIETAYISPFPDTAPASDTAGRKQQPVVQNHDQHAEKPHEGDASSPDVVLDGRQQEVSEALQEERRERRVRYHDDSGFRPLPPPSDAGDSSVLDVPPRYDAAI